jgi:hypothetical protein
MIQEATVVAEKKCPAVKVAIVTARKPQSLGFRHFDMTMTERLAWTRAAIRKVDAMIEEYRRLSALLTKCLGFRSDLAQPEEEDRSFSLALGIRLREDPGRLHQTDPDSA